MYHTIVKQKLRSSFAQVNAGNLDAIVAQFTPDAEHWFSGDHALSGRRQGSAQIQQWYDRLGRVLPDLRFEITGISVSGLPNDTVAMVEWIDHFTDPAGAAYTNQGVHVVRLAWGKIRSLHIFCDTQVITAALGHLAEQGREEAAAEPIGTPTAFATV
ncbi:MAG: nuclear transport factor 2 family protein [Tetrasphaera sp.]